MQAIPDMEPAAVGACSAPPLRFQEADGPREVAEGGASDRPAGGAPPPRPPVQTRELRRTGEHLAYADCFRLNVESYLQAVGLPVGLSKPGLQVHFVPLSDGSFLHVYREELTAETCVCDQCRVLGGLRRAWKGSACASLLRWQRRHGPAGGWRDGCLSVGSVGVHLPHNPLPPPGGAVSRGCRLAGPPGQHPNMALHRAGRGEQGWPCLHLWMPFAIERLCWWWTYLRRTEGDQGCAVVFSCHPPILHPALHPHLSSSTLTGI